MTLAMNPIPLLSRLWWRPRQRRAPAPALRVQAPGLDAQQARELEQLLQPLHERLAIDWRLVSQTGDVVLVSPRDAEPAEAPPQDTVVCDLPHPCETVDTVAARFERRQRTLLAQLRALPQVRRRSPHFGAGGWDPEVVDTVPAALEPADGGADDDESHWHAPSLPLEQERLLRRARAAQADGLAMKLHLGYGPTARIEIDFASGQALLDPTAQQALRVHGQLPQMQAPCRVGADALPCDAAAVLWDMGLAAGGYRLLDQPNDWWASQLDTPRSAALLARSRLPSHRRLAALLAQGPTTPQLLLQRSGVPLATLRRFVQAALMLGLVRWGR
jgi:hypothetical protein